MKEYIVVLKPDVDYGQFWSEIESTSAVPHIPDRPVDIANDQKYIDRLCNYYLSDEEAEQLRNDDRVLDVEDLSEKQIGHYSNLSSVSFAKTSSSTGAVGNWGLKRCNSATNNYSTSTADPGGGYNYTLDGTGVDVVITDSGIQPTHPEFLAADGTPTRLKQIDWYSESSVTGVQNANHYRDYGGHGTHVAGIVAGSTFGWAKNANIYAIKIQGLEGTGDSGTGIPISDLYNVIIGWHNRKTPDPVTGLTRPTIVNMSWGFYQTWTSSTGGNYRGTPWTNTAKQTAYGMVFSSSNTFGVRYSSQDASIDAMIAAGIHVCIAAGNSGTKIDVVGGVDYNNYYTDGGGSTVYYHRGSSPYSDNAFMVGAVNQTAYSATLDQRAFFSCSGPGVNIWAPGYFQMSACSALSSDLTGYSPATYFANSSYKQCSVAGTSQASPQVCGAAALMLQLNPRLTPAQLKTAMLGNATATLRDTGLNNDYTSGNSLMGSANKMLYNKFNAGSESLLPNNTLSVSGTLTLKLS